MAASKLASVFSGNREEACQQQQKNGMGELLFGELVVMELSTYSTMTPAVWIMDASANATYGGA